MAVPIRIALVLVCSLGVVRSFNLEPRIPIVKKGSARSHFGYTVAQHQTILESRFGRARKESWILVGAPKDHNLQPGTDRSGALWKCPLTTYTSDCTQVHTDGYKNPETGLYNFDSINETLSEPSEDEIKDDQWLGVTLKSQGPGGKVLVCAHRYMHKGNGFQWGFGMCYILTQSLDVADYMEPCRGKPVNQGHQQYGFCQAGTSGLLLEDEAVLGVPGPYTWRGTVHTANTSDDFLFKDKTQYFGPVTENDSPVDKYSYLGYSVAAGRFFGSHMSYVGGAPRSNGTGQVVFFSREKIGVSMLNVELVLNGEKFASSYGFEILAVDINGDRKDDLVVGAPFYFTGTASGAIYIYMNNDGGFTRDHPYKKIEGVAGETRFGFSMTSMGDLNHDGYTDVAVGAPYQGQGAVYIYLGSQDGLIEKPAQIIEAEDMPGVAYNAFGYSLSGGMDLDGNGYPDLLTSSFCSDRVLLIRARPIIDIQTKVETLGQLENIDPTKKGCNEDPDSTDTCFSFDACFKMFNEAGTQTVLRLKYTIEERVYKDRPIPRVRFSEGLRDKPSVVERIVSLRPEDMGEFQCSREIVYLIDGPRNILRPLRFKLSYEIIQREPRPVAEGQQLPDIDNYPILNQQEALKYFEGTFAKDCGDDDICESDLNAEGWLVLERNSGDTHYVLRLGEQDTVPLHLEVKNTGEPAYQSSVIIRHHKAFIFEIIETETGNYQCNRASDTLLVCSIGNPLTDTTGPMTLTFRESGQPFDSRFISFIVSTNSSSTEKTPQQDLRFNVEVIKRAEISIIGSVAPEQVFYGGEVVGESAIKHLEEIGSIVTHKYVVDNRGPWRVSELQVEVQWPYQVENGKDKGKWLLYLTDPPIVDGVGECDIDPKYINPLARRRSKPEFLTGEGEVESTDYPSSTPVPDGSGSVGTGGTVSGGTVSGGTIITSKKTTTIKKTNTTTTTHKKTTSKSSSEKTSTGSSSSGSSSTSSSSGSSGTYSSSSSSSEGSGDGSSGYDSGRDHGRSHVRYSRRVSSSSDDRTRFDDNNLESVGDDEGRVIEEYDRTRTSSGTSDDGRTHYQSTHRETKKVTVNEENIDNDDIPDGRWGDGGGYRRTYSSSSSTSSNTRTRQEEPEEGRRQWESRRTSYSNQGGRTSSQESHTSGTHGGRTTSQESHTSSTHGGPGWREETGSGRTESSVYGTHSRGYGQDRDEGNTGHGNVYEEERRTTHTGGSRSYSGGTRTSTERYGWTGESGQSGTSRTELGSRRGESDGYWRSESDGYRDESDGDRSSTGSHRGESGGSWRSESSGHRGEGGGSWRSESEGHRREGDGSWRSESDGHRREGDGSWRSESDGHRRESGHTRDHADRRGEGGYRTTYEYESTRRHGSTVDDGNDSRRGQGINQDTSDRSSGSHRQHSSSQGGYYDRNEGGRTTTTDTREGSRWESTDADGTRREHFDWGDSDSDGHRRAGYESRSEGGRRTYSEHGSESGHYRDNTGGYDGSRQQIDPQRHGGESSLRTTTWELNSGQDRRGSHGSQSHHQHHHDSSQDYRGGHDSSRDYRGGSSSGRIHYESGGSETSGTFKRVEIDPETGETITYTRRVSQSSDGLDDWGSDSSSFTDHPEDETVRNKRDLSRVKREKEMVIKPQAVTDAKTGKTMQVVHLKCDGTPTAKCFVFRCSIRNLGAQQSRSIHIRSRLWNSTLVEDYPRVSYVSIKSKATLILPDDIREDQDQSDDTDSAETYAYPDLLDQLPPEEVPLWVILVSIFAGLLVLIIIVLILWKLGFFERKRPDPTLSGNLDKDANGY